MQKIQIQANSICANWNEGSTYCLNLKYKEFWRLNINHFVLDFKK